MARAFVLVRDFLAKVADEPEAEHHPVTELEEAQARVVDSARSVISVINGSLTGHARHAADLASRASNPAIPIDPLRELTVFSNRAIKDGAALFRAIWDHARISGVGAGPKAPAAERDPAGLQPPPSDYRAGPPGQPAELADLRRRGEPQSDDRRRPDNRHPQLQGPFPTRPRNRGRGSGPRSLRGDGDDRLGALPAKRSPTTSTWTGSEPGRPVQHPPAVHTIRPVTQGIIQRRPTVLFCDLVDSSHLAEQLDGEQFWDVVVNYQDACNQVVSRFDGYIYKSLGDGLIVLYGLPLAHEDDARRAVYTGLGIVEAVRGLNPMLMEKHGVELSVRVGIHTGEVVVGKMRGITEIAGSTPAQASRIQGAGRSRFDFDQP